MKKKKVRINRFEAFSDAELQELKTLFRTNRTLNSGITFSMLSDELFLELARRNAGLTK